jgi:hypothetical protein
MAAPALGNIPQLRRTARSRPSAVRTIHRHGYAGAIFSAGSLTNLTFVCFFGEKLWDEYANSWGTLATGDTQ